MVTIKLVTLNKYVWGGNPTTFYKFSIELVFILVISIKNTLMKIQKPNQQNVGLLSAQWPDHSLPSVLRGKLKS